VSALGICLNPDFLLTIPVIAVISEVMDGSIVQLKDAKGKEEELNNYALVIIHDIVSALAYLHSFGVTHNRVQAKKILVSHYFSFVHYCCCLLELNHQQPLLLFFLLPTVCSGAQYGEEVRVQAG